jgi:FAD/FMN-containing dehydrogenase
MSRRIRHPMLHSSDDLAALKADLGPIPHADDAATLRLKSRDFFWFSPILKEQLDGRLGDLVISPRDEAEVIRVAALAAKHRVPITVRAGGTGNYGQSVPLKGGIVLDLTGLDGVIFARTGVGRFKAGARMLEIDRALKPLGQELRFYPSTRKQVTIGGLVAGGAAGAGTCTWGQISDAGAVLGLRVVTVEEAPRVIELRGADVYKVMHAYGVNGIITEVEVPLAPRHDWAERIASFPSLAAAARFGMDFMSHDAIAKKLVSVHDARIPAGIKRLAAIVPDGRAMALLMVSEPQAGALEDLVAAHGGTIDYARDAEAADRAAFEGEGDLAPIYEYSWNHTTLHWIRTDPTITYLQIRFPPDGGLELLDWVVRAFPDEVLMHLEFQRRFGRVTFSGLPVIRYSGRDRLYEIIAALNARDVQVADPHTYVLDNAGWKKVDSGSAEFKSVADPHGLMNPGKLKAWPPVAV